MPIKKIDLKKYVKPSDYISFPQGNTEIVLLSDGGMAKMHSMKTARGFMNLGVCPEDDTCKHCQKALSLPEDQRAMYIAKNKWIWPVYMIEKECVRLMEAGPMLGNQICVIAQQKEISLLNSQWRVNKTGEGFSTEYEVEYLGVYRFTDEQTKLVEPAKKFLIKKHYS